MNAPLQQPDAEVTALIGEARGEPREGTRRSWLAAAALALSLAAWGLLRRGDERDEVRYVTEPVTRGDLVSTVSATGTLEPTNQIDVGSELSGLVVAVLVEENDRVAKGQELARLDTSKLDDEITRTRASLASSEARVAQANATVAEARASVARLREVSRLSGGKVPSRAEMDAATATLARSLADEANARAAVAEASAVSRSAETNREKASIRSPIDGIVLARKIEPGQTVAASFATPVLFTLAEDLAQMELQVSVDEADVGQVREGQQATFGVDAYPGRKYPAQIRRVAYGSQTTDGVVTYKTLLTVDNDDLTLRPGMTAVAQITTATRHDALLVPNAALRFSPEREKVERPSAGGGIVGSLLPRPPSEGRTQRPPAPRGGAQKVWLLHSGEPTPVDVEIGVSDGRITEIVAGDLEPGAEIITEAAGESPP